MLPAVLFTIVLLATCSHGLNDSAVYLSEDRYMITPWEDMPQNTTCTRDSDNATARCQMPIEGGAQCLQECSKHHHCDQAMFRHVGSNKICYMKLNLARAQCSNPDVTGFGSKTIVRSSGATQGMWMKDQAFPQQTTIYYASGYTGSTVQAFSSESAFQSGTVANTWSVPSFHGPDHAVYDGCFYGIKASSKVIYQYNFQTGTTKEHTLSDAGNTNQCHYNWGGYSDVDFSVDDSGIWVIYGVQSNGCKMKLSKIDTSSFSIVQSWTMTWTKQKGNAFMVCGKLYVLNSYSGSNYIVYTYDTNTETATTLSSSTLPYTTDGYLSSMDYNSHDKMLYVWDSGKQLKYPVSF